MRTVGLGLLLGLAVSFAVVAFAQRVSGVPMPLVTALQAAGLAADVNVVVAGVPATDVFLPATADDWRAVLELLARVNGLSVCELGPATLLVTDSVRGEELCGDVPAVVPTPVVEQVLAVPAVAAEESGALTESGPPVGLRYRVRVLQLDETRALDLGIDWSGGLLETAARLVAGAAAVSSGVVPVAEMDGLVRFLESEGVAVRLEDVELRAESGVPVRFNRGGTIAVNLVGGGNAAISDRYNYGLGLDLSGVVEDGSVLLTYRLEDSSPSNVSDPTNVQLASTTSGSVVRVACDSSVVVAAIGSSREGLKGAGVPVLASVPVLGFGFGTGGAVTGRTTFVVTVDVGCLS